MRTIMYGLALCVAVMSACKKSETLTREEVIAAIEKFDSGWRSKNMAQIDSILSPSYIYFTQSGGTFERKNVVATAGSSDYRIDSVYRRTFDIKIDGNTAVVNTTWHGIGSYYGDPFDDRQRCSITLIKKAGRITLLSEHCTVMK